MKDAPPAPGMRLAVHLHIYYAEMWPKMRAYLTNMGDYPYDLYVTLVGEHPELERELERFRPGVIHWRVENRGYDVGPFTDFLNRVDLAQYDLILKLHTKNDTATTLTWVNFRCVTRKWWSRMLLDALLGSRKRFADNIRIFERESDVGMVGSAHLTTSRSFHKQHVKELLHACMDKLGYRNWRFRFVAGTMFMVRSSIMQPLKCAYEPGDFEVSRGDVSDGTLAHALERVFGCITLAQGYRLRGVGWSLRFELASVWHAIWQFVYKKKITTSRRLIIKICKIPVWRSALPADKKNL